MLLFISWKLGFLWMRPSPCSYKFRKMKQFCIKFLKIFDSIYKYFCEEFLLLCSSRKLICAFFWVVSQSLTSGQHRLQRMTPVAFLLSVICGRSKKGWLGFFNSSIVFSSESVQAWTLLWRPLITASISLLFMDLFELFLFSRLKF